MCHLCDGGGPGTPSYNEVHGLANIAESSTTHSIDEYASPYWMTFRTSNAPRPKPFVRSDWGFDDIEPSVWSRARAEAPNFTSTRGGYSTVMFNEAMKQKFIGPIRDQLYGPSSLLSQLATEIQCPTSSRKIAERTYGTRPWRTSARGVIRRVTSTLRSRR